MLATPLLVPDWKLFITASAAWTAACFLMFFLTTSFLYPKVVDQDYDVFGSDAGGGAYMLQTRDLQSRDAFKHPLFALVGQPAVYVVHTVLRTSPTRAAQLFLAGLAALNVVTLLVLVRAFYADTPTSLLVATFYALSFANLVIFSIPETYALSMLFVMLHFAAFLLVRPRFSNVAALWLGVLAGLAGLSNPPLLTIGLIPGAYLLMTRGIARSVVPAGIMFFASVAVFLGVVLVAFGPSFFSFSTGYLSRWASLANFLDVTHITQVATHFFLYAILGPGSALKRNYSLADTSSYFTSPLGVLAAFGYLLMFLLLARHLARSKDPVEQAVSCWILLITAFFVYFNPKEAILYSPQVLPFICVLLAAALSRVKQRRVMLAFGIATVCALGANNLVTLSNTAVPVDSKHAPVVPGLYDGADALLELPPGHRPTAATTLPSKTALITGVTGQVGAYLSD